VSGSRIALAPPDLAPAGEAAPPRGEPAAPQEDERAGDERAGGFMERAEVRDVLAWMRLLVDPRDAAAVVRALARPPIELRQVDLVRVIALARRRKLDLVLGVVAATESPQVPPEARARIERFVELHRGAVAELDTIEPDVFMARLIERVSSPGRALRVPEDAAGQDASFERLRALAAEFVRGNPRAGARELASHLTAIPPAAQQGAATVAQQSPTGTPELDATSEVGQPSAPVDRVGAALHLLREEVLASVGRIGGRLGELRLDTELDISHGVVRFLELLKLSALLQRPGGQSMEEALADINTRLLAASTPLQREIFQTSTLDQTLSSALSADEPARCDDRALARAVAPREEHSLAPFLPRKGTGLALSASDIETYRSCPLRYKFARVLRIPTEQTVHQRFGIMVHQVLERYHSEGASTLERMLDLLDAGWRRAALGNGEYELELRGKALAALTRYHERLAERDSQPVWFERQFSFRLGPHHLRGRVDRVDRLRRLGGNDGIDARGDYELIDYKTGRPRTAEQLKDDVQLSLYALAAREDWRLESSRQAYYYVLDDVRVPVPESDRDTDAVKAIVLEVGEGILAQDFSPTPSRAVCSLCDYRIVCPAAEG